MQILTQQVWGPRNTAFLISSWGTLNYTWYVRELTHVKVHRTVLGT